MALSRSFWGLPEESDESLEEAEVDPNESIHQKLLTDQLLDDEVEDLPDYLKELFKAKKHAERMDKLRSDRIKQKKINRKVQAGKELNPDEIDFIEEKTHKVSSIKSPEVHVDPAVLLTDIVNGDYTLQDVHSVREGAEAASQKDEVENSPLQFLDNLIEQVKEQTHESLKTKDPGQFFENLNVEQMKNVMPARITDAVNHADTAIDLALGEDFETTEAELACKSYIKALAMTEAEMKLKQVIVLAEKSRARQEVTELRAEIAAVSGALSEEADRTTDTTTSQPLPKSKKQPGFDISQLNYDISFLPSSDPDVYKPLEIISYIGLTKNTS